MTSFTRFTGGQPQRGQLDARTLSQPSAGGTPVLPSQSHSPHNLYHPTMSASPTVLQTTLAAPSQQVMNNQQYLPTPVHSPHITQANQSLPVSPRRSSSGLASGSHMQQPEGSRSYYSNPYPHPPYAQSSALYSQQPAPPTYLAQPRQNSAQQMFSQGPSPTVYTQPRRPSGYGVAQHAPSPTAFAPPRQSFSSHASVQHPPSSTAQPRHLSGPQIPSQGPPQTVITQPRDASGPLPAQPPRRPISSSQQIQGALFPAPNVQWQGATPAEPNRFALHQSRLDESRLLLDASRHVDLSGTKPRAYRYFARFAHPPHLFTSKTTIFQWHFNVSQDDLNVKGRSTGGGGPLKIEPGTILFRLRCLQGDGAVFSDPSQWSVSHTHWPKFCFWEVNSVPLEERRKAGHGRDLPIDITDHVKPGENSVALYCNMEKDKKTTTYSVAVELVKVDLHDNITTFCRTRSYLSSRTLSAIRRELSSEDDDIQITSMTINLCDPMLAARIWKLPVRGPECRHREALDLETFLQSRPHRAHDELSLPDVWSCPMCGADVRPNVLMVDEWLVEMRCELEKRGRLDARAIMVDRNGDWTIVEEQNDNTDHHSKTKAQESSNDQIQPQEAILID